MERIYIFLDVDGVFNNINMWTRNYFKYGISAGTYSIDERNIKRFAKLYRQLRKKYEVYCVLSSTWRTSKDGQAVIYNRLRDNGVRLEGTIDINYGERGDLIQKYLANLDYDYDLAIALDDDSFDIKPFLNKKFRLVQTNGERGFTRKDSFKIKRIIKEMERYEK